MLRIVLNEILITIWTGDEQGQTSREAKVVRGKIMRSQHYIRNYWQLRNVKQAQGEYSSSGKSIPIG